MYVLPSFFFAHHLHVLTFPTLYSADIACVCTSYAFQEAARECISANCTAADLTAAQELQNLECTACMFISLIFLSTCKQMLMLSVFVRLIAHWPNLWFRLGNWCLR